MKRGRGVVGRCWRAAGQPHDLSLRAAKVLSAQEASARETRNERRYRIGINTYLSRNGDAGNCSQRQLRATAWTRKDARCGPNGR